MQSAKEKISNTASAAKEHVEIYKAKVEEKIEKAAARTEEEKKIAEEKRKAKEAEAKKELHEAKARHAAEKLSHKQVDLHHGGHAHHTAPVPAPPDVGGTATAAPVPAAPPSMGTHGHHHHEPVETADTMAGATVPTYPLGTLYPANKYL